MSNLIHTSKKQNLVPLDIIQGYRVRPGFFRNCGATVLDNAVNFTITSVGATSCELLLFHRQEEEPFAVLPFPESYRIGNVYSMIVFDLDIEDLEYAYRLDGPYDLKKGLLFDKTKYLLDPYAKAVTGQSLWGECRTKKDQYRARVVRENFDWGKEGQLQKPMEDLIIYELHVRGFTVDPSSKVKCPGTFAGLKEKIPYLKDLGVNAVELMPIFEFDELRENRTVDGKLLLDYWGYNTVSYFSPNTSYSSRKEENSEGWQLKDLIRELHKNDIEVILDVVFNHTAEGNEKGPFFSFKGFDNNIYYMLTPDGKYYNFSGCGNTLNCNHPIVRNMIIDCLRYWTTTYRIDGFRFDLASILGRNQDGSPMSQPPLLQSLAFDPILGNVKLIAEAWDAGGLYQVGSFPSWNNRWLEWNGKYRDDLRSFLKGDNGKAEVAAKRMMGSQDLYPIPLRGPNASVNFINCHDGFTLYDMYAYNQKHNEKNGWNNTDGCNDNFSWNCGAEGETDDPKVNKLRRRMMKNAILTLMCSRGTPMFFMGDEFANSQKGNNNAYCQDNEIAWLNWNDLEKNKDIFEFFQYMIRFRKEHSVIRKKEKPCSLHFPEMSTHSNKPWVESYDWSAKVVGVLYAGSKEEKDDMVYVVINAYWEPQQIEIPGLLGLFQWKKMIDTNEEASIIRDDCVVSDGRCTIGARSAMVFVAEQIKKEG